MLWTIETMTYGDQMKKFKFKNLDIFFIQSLKVCHCEE